MVPCLPLDRPNPQGTFGFMNATDRQTALVTGAGRRIGRAIALDLAAAGFAVAVHHRAASVEAEEVATAIREGGGRAVAIAADLAEEAQVTTLLPRATEALGPVTLLVNNASVFERDEWNTATRESWDRHLETNLRAPLVLTQAMAGALPEGMRGLVVNILDQRVLNLTPHFLSYTIAKSGLWTLTRTLAMALAPRIRVNGVGPGPTLRNERQSDEHFAVQSAAVPMGRSVEPGEICAAIRFLIDAPSVTGQMIAVDGGEHLGWAQPARGIVPVE
jgi:NAD(P)-dependent dehydrogenase (short-subunit alcohol dehydrogenase family)